MGRKKYFLTDLLDFDFCFCKVPHFQDSNI